MTGHGIDRDTFFNFCTKLLIPTKEYGLIRLRPSPTQVYLIDQILEGLDCGIHQFTVLKCRQARVTTICLAFELYWLFRHEGLIGSFIADNSERRSFFSQLINDYIKSLDQFPDFHIPVDKSNNEYVALQNRSMLVFSHANQRSVGNLGRGMGVSMVHGTEVGLWKDQAGLASLLSSLATKNPHRLFIFEGTAQGHNQFKTMWDLARKSAVEKAIFVGWWLHEDFRYEKETPQYKTYWEVDPAFDQEERKWAGVVKRRYGVEITPEHMAWWRYTLNEKFNGDLELMYQENPPHDELAFQFSGNPFLSKKALNYRLQESADALEKARYFRFIFPGGATSEFMEMKMVEVPAKSGWHDLIVWEPPRIGLGVVYVIGADPAHGSSEQSCNASVQVLRCYADKIEQVAEFSRRNLPAYQLAWVILYLYGAYHNECIFSVEVQGGGHEVYAEIQRVQSRVGQAYPLDMCKHFQGLQHYLYTRPDTRQKAFSTIHWKTTPDNRERMMEAIRTFTEKTPLFILRSRALVDELAGLIRTQGGKIESAGEDDRVMALAIALVIYVDHIIFKFAGAEARRKFSYNSEDFTRERETRGTDYLIGDLVHDRLVSWREKVMKTS